MIHSIMSEFLVHGRILYWVSVTLYKNRDESDPSLLSKNRQISLVARECKDVQTSSQQGIAYGAGGSAHAAAIGPRETGDGRMPRTIGLAFVVPWHGAGEPEQLPGPSAE